MRVHLARLLQVLDPDAVRPKRMECNSPSRRRVVTGSPTTSARGRQMAQEPGGAGVLHRGQPTESTRCVKPGSAKDSDTEEGSAFDMLHTDRGFLAFEQWYRRALVAGVGANASMLPRPEMGLLWPQTFCPANGVHEHAFLELVRWFADCSDSEAFDLFDLLDHSLLGVLGLPQVYLSICLMSALGCRQLTKFLYFHSTWLFSTLSKGSVGSPPERVAWPRLLSFLRLVGAPCHLVSRASTENGIEPLAQLTYDEFLDVTFSVLWQLDRGAEHGESTVIHESERLGHVRSRTCAIL